MPHGSNEKEFDVLVGDALRKLNDRYMKISNKPGIPEIMSLLQRADDDRLAAVKAMLEDTI